MKKNKNRPLGKHELLRRNISLSEQDYKNAKKLMEELSPSTLSGLFRYLINSAINNLDFFKKLNRPMSITDSSLTQQIELYKQIAQEERELQEKDMLEVKEKLSNVEEGLKIFLEKYGNNKKENQLGGKIK